MERNYCERSKCRVWHLPRHKSVTATNAVVVPDSISAGRMEARETFIVCLLHGQHITYWDLCEYFTICNLGYKTLSDTHSHMGWQSSNFITTALGPADWVIKANHISSYLIICNNQHWALRHDSALHSLSISPLFVSSPPWHLTHTHRPAKKHVLLPPHPCSASVATNRER